jgi:hypothetical protein
MRLRNLIILLAAIIAVGMTGILLLRDHKRQGMRADAERSFSRLATCLVGAPGKGRPFTDALAEAKAREAIDPRGTDWPKRCRAYTDEAMRTHTRAYAADVVQVDGSITAVAEALDKNEVPPAAILDGLASLWTEIPADVAQPRAAIAPAALSALPPLHAVMPVAGIDGVDVRGSTVHVVLTGQNDRDPPRVRCELDAKLEGFTCPTPPPDAVFAVLAADHGLDPYYVKFGTDVRAVVIDAKGNEILRLPSFGYGYAFADGRLAVLSYGGEGTSDRLVMVREASGATTSRSIAGIADRFRASGSWILWKEADPDQRDAPAKVKAFDVASAEAPVELGTVQRRGEGGRSSADCRSDTHQFVDLSPAVAIRDPAKGWVLVEQTPRGQYATRTMACRGDTLVMTDATATQVTVQTCTVAGCTKKDAVVGVDAREYWAGALGNDVLLVWTDGASVLSRRGPIETLADAPIVELARAGGPIVMAHLVGPSVASFQEPPAPPALVPTPEGVVVFVMGKESPTLSAVLVPGTGAPRALTSR